MAILYANRVIYWRFTPHILMIIVQTCFSFQYFLTETAFNKGLNPHVFVTYRYVTGSIVIVPFAYLLERKVRPRLTFVMFLELFVLAFMGTSLTLNMYFASLKYTSPTFITSMLNTIPAITFVLAVILRLEVVDIRSLSGIAKILGTLTSLAGVIIITFYRGPQVPSLPSAPIHIKSNHIHRNWIKGSFLLVASCISWSMWFIMQAYTLKRYAAPLSLTAWTNCLGAAQSAIFMMLIDRKPSTWSIKFIEEFWAITYSGVISCGIAIFVQLWCTTQRGPVFVTVFNSLSTVLVATLAYFIFGEELHTGSILGGAVVIVGLYLLLSGKEGDHYRSMIKQQSSPTHDQEKGSQTPMGSTVDHEFVERELTK